MPTPKKQPVVDERLSALIRKLAKMESSDVHDVLAEWVRDELTESGHVILDLIIALCDESNYGALESVIAVLNHENRDWISDYLTHEQAVDMIACLVDPLLDHENEDLDEAIIEAISVMPSETIDQLRDELESVIDDDDIWDIIKKMFRAVS